ncbi:MAG: hypothetical protein JSR24_10445 [Proteobacteria bacterium]|nr:hypothetical protein [Pseudomonadota bacterium]
MVERLARRRVLQVLGTGIAPAIAPSIARADFITPKNIVILVGFSPGGGIDVLSRVLAPRVESRIGRRIKVENHAGNNGALVSEALKKGPNDGSLIACVPSTAVAATVTDRGSTFDPRTDMVPLSLAGSYPMVLAVSPASGVATLAEYAEWLRADPARARIGVSGSGGYLDTWVKLLGRELGVEFQGVPYRGGRPLINDLQNNKVSAGVLSLPTALEFHRGGKLRIILTSGDKPAPFAPKLVTATQAGRPNVASAEWYGFFSARGTPAPVVAEWNFQIRTVLAQKETAAELINVGVDIQTSTPEELATRLDDTLAFWKKRVLALGMQSTD